MNMTARDTIRKSSLENEVLISVILLYFVISTALLLIHHLQPEDAVTQTSSPSPSHAAFYVGAAPPAAPAAPLVDVAGLRLWIERAGYTDVRDLRLDGEHWQATATREGRRWLLRVDPRPVIVATPVEPTP